jgi:hypothetical protein
MPLLQVLIILVIAGVVLWLINNYLPMDNKIKKILNVVAVIIVVLWLLSIFGVLDSVSRIRIGR